MSYLHTEKHPSDLESHSSFTTVLELLQFRASEFFDTKTKDQLAYTFLGDGENVSDRVTFAELGMRSRRIAAYLQTVTSPGDRVLVVHQPSLEYIIAFFACVYAGVIAVPALPPTNARTLPRLQLIMADAMPTAALASTNLVQQIERWSSASDQLLKRIHWITSDNLPEIQAVLYRPPTLADDIVFLQYTSGSTGAPKGVMVTHRNLLSNVAHHQSALGLRKNDVFVSWLPPFHDFGLVCGIAYPLFVGCHCVQFPAAAFLRRPYRWLKVLSDYRARMTGAPNFAYDLCVAHVSERELSDLDLSALEYAANGAERIRSDTIRSFAEKFSRCGFRAEAITPGYGMAEATLMVTCDVRSEAQGLPQILSVSKRALARNVVEVCYDTADCIELVSNGRPRDLQHQVVVVNPESCMEVDRGEVGEIWIRGPSVAAGYWRQPNATADTFAGILRGRRKPHLRTGDLGFIHEDDLYIVGRIKEVMIFNGRNIYPQDVEATIEKLDPSFRENGCAVFSLEERTVAQLVVVQEIESRSQPRLDSRDLLTRGFGLSKARWYPPYIKRQNPTASVQGFVSRW
jgi:acyl-CoA synthetase (AMP-forming)/AMP-acid ligase II